MKALPRSQAARRRAAAAVAVASVGAGILGTQSAEAEIVSIASYNACRNCGIGTAIGVSVCGMKHVCESAASYDDTFSAVHCS